MADVRALLKAKRQEVRITHPYAAYSATGALRCTACGATIKFATAWEGHLGSKAHRVAVAKLRAAQEEKEKLDKPGAEMVEEEEDVIMMEREPPTTTTTTKRPRTEEEDPIGSQHAPAFPADFFSDPSRASMVQRGDDDDDEGDEDMDEEKSKPKPKSQFDTEWAAFEQDMQTLQQSSSSGPTTTTAAVEGEAEEEVSTDPQERYARATIAAEPELVPQFEGLPLQQQHGRDVAGNVVVVVTGEQVQGRPGQGQGQQGPNVSEEERRRRQLEEHELIMDRLLEEERAQEEADSRVAVLKSRVEMLKKKRELARGKKADSVRT
jgi:zinc finger protein 830